MYDLIGDIHGGAVELEALLVKLGYQRALSEQNSEYLRRATRRPSRSPKIEDNQWAQILNPILGQNNRFYSDNARLYDMA